MSDADGSNGTDAPPGDGSQGKGEWKPPSDGSWLPKKRVDEMVNDARGEAARAREEAARLRADLEVARTAPKKDEPKIASRAELNQLVADGKITQEAADAHYDRQLLEAAKREAKNTAAAEVAGQQRELTVNAQMNEYRQLMPAAWEVGSKERAKVEKEFASLVKLGLPSNSVTEVAALRAAFGDPEVIRASRSTGSNGPGETHAEIGGGERPGTKTGEDADGAPRDLTPRQKEYYADKIRQGVYPGWKAVTEELKFARPRATAR